MIEYQQNLLSWLVSADVISPYLALIEFMFIKGSFPDPLKVAKVVPIYKSAPKHAVENYRTFPCFLHFQKLLKK